MWRPKIPPFVERTSLRGLSRREKSAMRVEKKGTKVAGSYGDGILQHGKLQNERVRVMRRRGLD